MKFGAAITELKYFVVFAASIYNMNIDNNQMIKRDVTPIRIVAIE